MTKSSSITTLHITLWVAQGLLALLFLWASFTKLFQPIEETAKMLPWASEHPALLRFTGLVELLGAFGLILPSALGIQPRLTIFAAYGTILLMVLGALFHISRGETSLIGMNIFILLIAAFVAWGRNKKIPILPKS